LSMPIDLPLLRTLAHSAPRSCTPAKKIVPRVTHRNAGSQPQITAIAGPTIGAAPATEVKWWPQSTNRLVGTESTPSRMVCAGVGEAARSREIVPAGKLE